MKVQATNARLVAAACRVLAALGLGAALGAGAADPAPSGEELRQAGEYQLRTRILHAGTRSEGRVGRLYKNGTEVPNPEPGHAIEVTTPGGTVRFTYLGAERPHLWSVSGWTDRTPPR